MPEFLDFKRKINEQFDFMSDLPLFKTDVSKDDLWEMYLHSFPEGSNPIFRERTVHDCQCCKQFIKACGNVVAIVDENLVSIIKACGNVITIADEKLVSIWDIEIGGEFQVVADALSKLVKSKKIRDAFLHAEPHVGTDFNFQEIENSDNIKWNHFFYKLPSRFHMKGTDIGTKLSTFRSNKEVFKRSLDDISKEAIETVLELIEQNSIYRGEEHKSIVVFLLDHKKKYDLLKSAKKKDYYAWLTSMSTGMASRVRNTVIGTLLSDISEGVELDEAVKMFESKVAPTNYKRPTALITKTMIEKAQEKVVELGFESALPRRFANIDDITINNILFANRTAKNAMNVFDEMANETPEKASNFSKVEEIGIDTFLQDVLPKAESIELMLENKHENNLMSLISPVNKDVKHLFKWKNNFSWTYNGEVADSMKARVKKAGGDVDGVLRFSIQWNDGDNNQNDFDAHCFEPSRNLIYYPNKGNRHASSGILDVDIQNPGRKVAVENITWNDINKMQEGEYIFLVHNYSHNGGMTGFTAEIEYDGKIYSFDYAKGLKQDEKVIVAKLNFSKEHGIRFIESLPSTHSTKEIWGINTNNFHNVNVVMNSPNYWDGESTGNRHVFFMMEDCHNDNNARGFFNEFLSNDLTEHRKVFEVLGSKMKAEASQKQLSGLGFSSTKRDSVLCRVKGSFNRVIKINF